jgi:ribosomal-protein-alanine N-acetyltransferase
MSSSSPKMGDPIVRDRVSDAALDLTRFFESPPVLQTTRLRLRQLTLADQDDVYSYGSDPDVTEFMIWPRHTSISDTVAFLASIPKNLASQTSLGFGIELKATGKIIGSVGIHNISMKNHKAEIGYVLARPYWGKGLMSEAVREVIRFAFDEMGMHRIEAKGDVDNERTFRVMERCDMTHEATFRDYELRRGKFVSVKMYGIVKM